MELILDELKSLPLEALNDLIILVDEIESKIIGK